MSGKLFLGGIPTRPDVQRLMEAFKTEPGTVIDYADVEVILGITRDQARFRTVTDAWRAQLQREFARQTIAEGGTFRVLTPEQQVSHGVKRMTMHGRAIRKTVIGTERIEVSKLTGDALRTHTLLRRHGAALFNAAKEACREIAVSKPVSGATLRLARGDE